MRYLILDQDIIPFINTAVIIPFINKDGYKKKLWVNIIGLRLVISTWMYGLIKRVYIE